jgi:hypothetical protein
VAVGIEEVVDQVHFTRCRVTVQLVGSDCVNKNLVPGRRRVVAVMHVSHKLLAGYPADNRHDAETSNQPAHLSSKNAWLFVAYASMNRLKSGVDIRITPPGKGIMTEGMADI